MIFFRLLRDKLIYWYITSLVTVTAFFYFAVHIYSLPYRNLFFVIILILLALEGYFIVRKLTNGLSKLSSKMKSITSEKLDEKIVVENDDEIGELASSFNELLDRLQEAFKRERQFIGDVAHELKTPLATQRSNIEVTLSKTRSASEYKETLTEVLSDNNRLATTLKNILDLAWSEAENAKVDKTPVNLTEVVSEVSEIATKLSKAKKIKTVVNVEKDVAISGTEDKIFRAFLNIADNAIKYTPAEGTIKISLSKRLLSSEETYEAVFRVQDTGVGISKDDLPHVFDRFYRGSKTKGSTGSGLGLAIAQAIIVAHKGRIDVKSSIGKGTLVTVTIPC